MNQPTLVNLYHNECTQGLRYHPFAVNLVVWEVVILLMICLIECVPNKTEDFNLNVFNIITGINETKILTCIMQM